MVNPDGVESNTRKNCAPNYGAFGFKRDITSYGVDINRNYGFKWFRWFFFSKQYERSTQQFNTEHWGYRGEYPFSEKETQAIRDFVNQRDFKISISYHSYGQYILYPWAYSVDPPPDEQLFISIADGIKEINNYTIIQGASWYYVLGSSDDWLYGKKDILAFTIELGRTYAPTNYTMVSDICIKHAGVNFYTCEYSIELNV
jgi:carboxypeptidase T